MTNKKYRDEVNKRGGARVVAALLNCNEKHVRKRMAGDVAVDREAELALMRLPVRQEAEWTADDYAREVNARGGSKVVAAALGLHVTAINRRMVGRYRVDAEARMALEGVPLAAEPHKWTRGRRPKWAQAPETAEKPSKSGPK